MNRNTFVSAALSCLLVAAPAVLAQDKPMEKTDEKKDNITKGVCFNCHKPGHLAKNCRYRKFTPREDTTKINKCKIASTFGKSFEILILN